MSAEKKEITVIILGGDGVGPEVVAEAQKVLNKVAEIRGDALNVSFKFQEELIGGCAIDATGKRTHFCRSFTARRA